jgi:hypothetical protein
VVSASTLTAAPDSAAPELAVDGTEVSVRWPDGGRTTCTWTAAAPAMTTT